MSDAFEPRDQEFVARAKQVLEHQAAELDSPTMLRLQRARRAALDVSPLSRWRLVRTGGLALASVAALALLLWATQPAREPHPGHLVEDLEFILSTDNVELTEDFEFYHWLADVDTTG